MSLEHVAGTQLVADGMTKQLTGQALQNFKKTLGIGVIEEKEKIEVKKVDLGGWRPQRPLSRKEVESGGFGPSHRGHRDPRGHPFQVRHGWSEEMVQGEGGVEGEAAITRSDPTDEGIRACSRVGSVLHH